MAEGAVLKCRDHCIPQAVSEAQTQGGNLNMHLSPQFWIKLYTNLSNVIG